MESRERRRSVVFLQSGAATEAGKRAAFIDGREMAN